MSKDYVFEDKNHFVRYVNSKLTTPSPLKIQKVLYFLWAIYAAFYGRQDNMVDISEGTYKYPKYLFDAKFEAWMYGPVEVDVWQSYKNNEYDKPDKNAWQNLSENLNSDIPEFAKRSIIDFIDKTIHDLNKVNDFGLVERTHKDLAWSSVYDPNKKRIPMNNEQIVNDYVSIMNTGKNARN